MYPVVQGERIHARFMSMHAYQGDINAGDEKTIRDLSCFHCLRDYSVCIPLGSHPCSEICIPGNINMKTILKKRENKHYCIYSNNNKKRKKNNDNHGGAGR